MATSVIIIILFWLTNALAEGTHAKTINDVQAIDTKFDLNAPRHHTEKYQRLDGHSLVLRRGEIFEIDAILRRNFNSSDDKIRIEMSFGSNPQVESRTLMYLPLESNLTQSRASARLGAVHANRLTIELYLPTTLAIGVWRLRISVKLNGTKQLSTYHCNEDFYIIFNPWSKMDQVFMAREDARDEFVLNERGIIYKGQHNLLERLDWNYGQFEPIVLPAIMFLLEKSSLNVSLRADVVQVSRALSGLLNSNDDSGLLVGEWKGALDGVSPMLWKDSPSIFKRYMNSAGRSVKYGQCWVFGGVTTTALRALGIPARTISNFVSAHDTDSSLTVDKFYNAAGGQLTGVNADSTWTFHVWSDAWMMRRDLPSGYSGWQAIDATPQEKSQDKYQLGPASLEAIKQGKVNYAYDSGFVYAEVAADLVSWRLDDSSSLGWTRYQVSGAHHGQKILTKRIGSSDQWEDITSQYKYPEGSEERRSARLEAIRRQGLAAIIQ